jgi:hypothetical protein
MVTVLGVPLIGPLFVPAVLGVITLYIIWSLSTRRKVASCTGGRTSAGRGPGVCVSSEPEQEVLLGDRAAVQAEGDSCGEGATQPKVQCASNARRKVFRSRPGDQALQTVRPDSDLTKKTTRKKHCKGRPGCCSKKNGASGVVEGGIETVKVFFGTQAGKSKVKYDVAVSSCIIMVTCSIKVIVFQRVDQLTVALRTRCFQ